MDIAKLADRITAETEKIIYGKEEQIRLIIMAMLAQGHVLLEDLPGVGKTTLIKTLSIVSGCASKRIQFVPDLLPADILGMNIYDRNSGEFRRIPGPVFTNLLLADEINRAVPRTQSALLEAMEERQVTIDGETSCSLRGYGNPEPRGIRKYFPPACSPDGPFPDPSLHGLSHGTGRAGNALLSGRRHSF